MTVHFLMAGVTAPSHIYPSLALITELVSRGHRVSYVVGDRLAELVRPTGAEVIGHPSVMPNAEQDWPADTGAAMRPFLDDAITALERITDLRARPDAVLYDIGGFAGRVAANRWNVPAVQLSPAYVAWEGMDEEMAEFTAALQASPTGQDYYATLRSWLSENGVALDADTFLGTPDSCVVLIPKVLQPNADRVGPQYVFAGPCIDPARTENWAPADGDERPIVYVSLGTAYTDQPELYRRCVQAFAEEYRLVLATGKVDPAVLEPLPDGVQAARRQPQLDVLAHASVFITHAGMGSAAESLWFGVPTVAVPQAVDQFANAAKLAELGAGIYPDSDTLDAAGLRTAVDAALERTEQARALRTEVRSTGGTTRAADAVERLCGAAISAQWTPDR